MNNIKISARQFAIFVILFSIGSTILYISSSMSQELRQDAWIGAAIGTGLSLLLMLLYIAIGRIFPNMTLVKMNEKVFGKWIGKLVSLSFIFFSFSTAALLLSDVGNFLAIQMMPETPSEVTQILFACIVIMGIRLGLETLARSAEILFSCFIVLFIIFVVSLFPHVELKNIQPIFESGIKPLVRSSLLFMSFFSLPLVVVLMIFPASVNQPKNAEKKLFIGVLIGGTCLTILIVLTIMVLGPDLSAAQMYPSYSLARKIEVGGFLQRVEAIMAAMWFITLYFKFVLYFYAAVIGLAQTLSLNDYLPLTLPLGMILVLLSFMINPNVAFESAYDKEVWIVYALSYGLVLPFLLLTGQILRKIIQGNKNQ
ncbi:Spore germination protein YndE [Neobacillus rhizosphaerae]|uniref:Spore germination protein YndE n=1 Tax=Neobacillus rhizosphaerae TaxID=2880965 RepID=A0ABN8KRG2_9BACI|nr:endospore germination permease [Neobacillus rhizosphaerae]CAH2715045.1 Spore germination protein YndE [Neobacillus rhizosphaerae]